MHKGVRCCVECGATSTPQWREGPMGPKTLCNACGVRRQRLLRKQQTANTARVPTAPVAAVQARRRAARQAPASLSDEFHYGSGSGSENSSDETTEVEWAPTVPASRQPIATPSRFRQPPVQDEPQDDCGSEEQSAAYDLLFLAGVDVSSAKQEGPNEAEDTDTRQQQQDEEEAVEHEEGGSGGNNWRQHHVRYSSHERKPPHLSYYNAHVHHLPRHHNTRRNVSTARRSDDLYYYYEAGDRGQEGDLGHLENEEERAEQQQRMGRGKGDVGVRKRRRVSSATPATRIRAQSVLPPSPAVTPSAEDLNEVSAHHHLPQSSAFSIDLSTLSLQSSGGAPAATPPPVCAAAPIPRGSTVYQLGPYGLRVQMPQNVPFFYHHNTSSTSYPHPLQHQLPTNQADFLLPGRLVPLQPLHPAPPGSAASASHHEDSPPEPSSLSPTAISLSPTQHLSPSVCGRFAAPSTVDSPPEPLPAQLSLTYQSALPPLQLPLPAVTARELEMLVHLQREFQRACLQLHQATAACEAVGSVVMERREAAESAREVATAASRLLASEVRAMADKYRLRDVLSELHGAMERGAEEDTLAAAAAMQHPVGAGPRGVREGATGAATAEAAHPGAQMQ